MKCGHLAKGLSMTLPGSATDRDRQLVVFACPPATSDWFSLPNLSTASLIESFSALGETE